MEYCHACPAKLTTWADTAFISFYLRAPCLSYSATLRQMSLNHFSLHGYSDNPTHSCSTFDIRWVKEWQFEKDTQEYLIGRYNYYNKLKI